MKIVHRSRIPESATVDEWRRQLADSICDLSQLAEFSTVLDKESLGQAIVRFPFSVTPYYLTLINAADPLDPIARMAIPSADELVDSSFVTTDPIEEHRHAVIPGVIRRYPDRILLLLTGRCAVYCRHCTRRAMGCGHIVPLSPSRLHEVIRFLRANPEIHDVILSGGDPLLLEDEELLEVVRAVRAVPTVDIIRIATRVPVTLPMRVTPSLVQALATCGPIFVNTHFNHPRELTDQAIAAVGAFVDAGIPVNNQAVLLKGVNNHVDTLRDLFRGLLRARVRPYYLFMCDPVSGTSHFRVSIDDAMDLMDALRGTLSGLAIPTLVLDLPGGHGKIPVERSRIVERTEHTIIFRAPDGSFVPYLR